MQYLYSLIFFIGFSLQAQEQPLEITLATTELPPFVNLNDQQSIEGLFIDMLNLAQEKTKLKITIFIMPWGRAVNEVKKGHIDAILPALWSKDRAEYLVYPRRPFYHFSQSVLIKRVEDNFEFTRLEDIGLNKIIAKTRAVKVDDTFDKLAKQQQSSIYETNKLEQALQMLAQNKVDLVASDGDVAKSTIHQLGLSQRFKLLPIQKQSPPSYIAFSRQFASKHDINNIMSMIIENQYN